MSEQKSTELTIAVMQANPHLGDVEANFELPTNVAHYLYLEVNFEWPSNVAHYFFVSAPRDLFK